MISRVSVRTFYIVACKFFTCFELRLAIALLLISVIVFNLLYNTYLGTVKMENLFARCPSIKHTGLVIFI